MNKFGGNWTYQKINIVELYAKAYLHVMKDRDYFKLMYFDGFAGSGEVEINGKGKPLKIEGMAKKVLAIDYPRMFDMYYFVELDKKKALILEESLNQVKDSGVYVVSDNCNEKLLDLANFLREEKGKNYRVLAFIDPCGMEVDWSSIEALKGLGIDLWILVPTGVGANRLLKKNGKISDAWLSKLESFFGIKRELIYENFYQEVQQQTLFGDTVTKMVKKENSIKIIEGLYCEKLISIFKHVSNPYIMTNSQNSIMFHLVMASNNKTAVKIANDVIKNINKN